MSSEEQESSESDNREQEEASTSNMLGVIIMVGATVTIAAIISQLTLDTLMRLDLGIFELVALAVVSFLPLALALYWLSND